MTAAEYTEKRRNRLKQLGFQRLDITVSPELFKRLQTYIRKYGGDSHPGHALVAWLDKELK